MVRETHHFAFGAGAHVGAACVAVLLIVLSFPFPTLAQQDDAIVRRLVEARTEETRAKWEKDLGKITGEQYRSRYNAAHERFLAANLERSKLPPARRDAVNRQYQTTYKLQITPLVQQWDAELQAQRDAKNDKKRQAIAAMNKDIPVAAQLQVKRTKLRQQRDKGQITEQQYQTQDRAAEQQLLAMANKHVATGFGTTFADLSAAEAEKILKRETVAAKKSAPSAPLPSEVTYRAPTRPWYKTNFWTAVFSFGGLAGFFSLLWFIWYLATHGQKSGSRLPPLSNNYGSATWGFWQHAPASKLVTIQGVFLGKSVPPTQRDAPLEGPGAPIIGYGDAHTLIVGRTRTGKGTRVIVPTLLRYAGGMLVIDPKGENAAITARSRRESWQVPVHIINPWGVLESEFKAKGFTPASYNPLDILDRNDPNAVATAQRLANAICPVTGKGDDLFWQQSAATILAAVFLWLADQPGESKTLARAREIVTLSRKKFTEQFLTKMVVSNAFGGAIREMVGNLIDLADQTYTGITANLTLTTAFISDPQLKKATNSSTFDISQLRQDRATVYLVIPPDQIEAQKTWLRLIIASATQMFLRSPPSEDVVPCKLLIDEFPALGKLQDIPTDISTMAGYKLHYILAVQGFDQLRAIYDKHADTILNNCAWRWYCNVTDLAGAKHLSESLGETTVRTEGKSFTSGDSTKGTSSSESTNFGEKGRRLLTPDEIINLGRDVAIIFGPGGPPMWLKPIDYWDLTKAFGHFASDPQMQMLYWKPPLTWDPNPYVPGSTGETGRGSTAGGQSQGGPGNAGGTGAGPNPGSGPKPPPGGGSGGSSGAGNSGQSQSGNSGAKPKQPPPMSAEEARAVLGVGPNATKKEINAAYRRLMGKVHPDHEGTTYLARKINEAKAILLGK